MKINKHISLLKRENKTIFFFYLNTVKLKHSWFGRIEVSMINVSHVSTFKQVRGQTVRHRRDEGHPTVAARHSLRGRHLFGSSRGGLRPGPVRRYRGHTGQHMGPDSPSRRNQHGRRTEEDASDVPTRWLHRTEGRRSRSDGRTLVSRPDVDPR